MWNEIKNIKSGKKQLKEFGLTIGIFLIVLGGLAAWRGKGSFPYLITAGMIFATCGLVLPRVLIPLQKAWMAFSVVMGFFMSRLILTILFYAVITPIGLIMRVSGKDILDERIDKKVSSYWRELPQTVKQPQAYEKQF